MSDERRDAKRVSRVGRTGARFPKFVEFDPVDEPVVETTVAPLVVATDLAPGDALVGRTGARFNSRARRSRREAERASAEDAAVLKAIAPAPAATRTGARTGDQGGPAADDAPTRPIFIPAPEESDPDDRVWVRPYVRTRGRTRSRTVLAIETLVSVPATHPEITDPEHLAIAAVCVEPRSVAEVAARIGVPLGVARVLIDDMSSSRLLTVHTLAVGRSGAPDVSIMKRVLDGLHRL